VPFEDLVRNPFTRTAIGAHSPPVGASTITTAPHGFLFEQYRPSERPGPSKAGESRNTHLSWRNTYTEVRESCGNLVPWCS
jgi:hypothetical protein